MTIYSESSAIVKKFLQLDGSITDGGGNLVYPANPTRAKQWQDSAPIVNKLLNKDGSLSSFGELLFSADRVEYTNHGQTTVEGALDTLLNKSSIVGGLEVLASRTLLLTDASLILDANSTDPIVITVPANDDVAFPIGTIIYIMRQNTGSVSIVGDTDVNILSESNNTLIGAQYTGAVLRKQAINTWNLIGNLTA